MKLRHFTASCLLYCHPELISGSNEKIHQYFVYILTDSKNYTLYIGVTNNLERCMSEHKNKLMEGFSKKYNCTRLVYFEEYQYVNEAIYREKQLKNWHRNWKCNLVRKSNPAWQDLSKGWASCLDPEINSGWQKPLASKKETKQSSSPSNNARWRVQTG